ncbi:MAG: hypothetical protein F6K08_33095 [Okeania sp. SIO1H6]|nr:hypothetical protein [Okeania sp. SIO1H6]
MSSKTTMVKMPEEFYLVVMTTMRRAMPKTTMVKMPEVQFYLVAMTMRMAMIWTKKVAMRMLVVAMTKQ